jgi:hypothetical protein
VKYSGKEGDTSRSATEDLGFVLEYGATDWATVELALREFVSNAIDRAIQEGEEEFLRKWFIENDYKHEPQADIPLRVEGTGTGCSEGIPQDCP